MNTLTLRLLSALVLGCLLLQPSAHSQTIANQKVGTASVSGTVTLKGKGLPGVVVVLRGSEGQPRPTVLRSTTDPEGNYRISKVPAGQYQALPLAPAFVTADVNRFGSQAKLVIVAEDENVTGIDFALVKGGVITGKVIDAEGKPVVEERLNLIPVELDQQNPWQQLGNFRTDDRGIYRIFGISAGRYKVAVGDGGVMGGTGNNRPRRPYRMTYHPDATDASQAALVEVREGMETSGIDIAVGRVLEGYAASGRIVDGETGQPLPNLRLGVASRDGYGRVFQPIRSVSSNRGEFKFEGLIPGRYNIVIADSENNPPPADPIPFEIVDHNVENLVVKTSKGSTLSGVVMLDGSNDKALLSKLYRMQLNVLVQGRSPGSFDWRSTGINPDGSFRLTGLPVGVATVNTVSLPNYQPVKEFVVLHTERDGTRLTQGVDLKAGEETSGLTVVIGHGTGAVRGEVIFVNGKTSPGSRLMAHLTREVIREGPGVPLRAVEVDARGHFAIEGMPAGTYWLQIYGYIPGARNQSARQEVIVADGAVTQVTITLDLNPTPGSNP